MPIIRLLPIILSTLFLTGCNEASDPNEAKVQALVEKYGRLLKPESVRIRNVKDNTALNGAWCFEYAARNADGRYVIWQKASIRTKNIEIAVYPMRYPDTSHLAFDDNIDPVKIEKARQMIEKDYAEDCPN